MAWIIATLYLYNGIKVSIQLFFAMKNVLKIEADPEINYPPISIIRPVKGLDEFSKENFRSWFEQSYPGQLEFIFSFQDLNDEAIDLVEKLKEEYSNLTVKVVKSEIRDGYSGKMSNIVNGVEQATFETLIFTDADTFAPEGVLQKLVSEHEKSGAVVCCTPFVTKAKNMWGHYYQIIYNEAITGLWLPEQFGEEPQCLAGPAIAIKKNVFTHLLEADGRFKNSVSTDVGLGEAVHQQGYRQQAGPIIHCPIGKISFEDFLYKMKRYAFMSWKLPRRNVIRGFALHHFIASYFFIAYFAFENSRLLDLIPVFLIYFSKVIYIGIINSYVERVFNFRLDYFLKDIAQYFVFWWSVLNPKLKWGQVCYKVIKNGEMVKET